MFHFGFEQGWYGSGWNQKMQRSLSGFKAWC